MKKFTCFSFFCIVVLFACKKSNNAPPSPVYGVSATVNGTNLTFNVITIDTSAGYLHISAAADSLSFPTTVDIFINNGYNPLTLGLYPYVLTNGKSSSL